MFLVLMPVIVPFFQSHGLSMQQIYFLITFFAGSVVILEVPSGYVSDLLGRKYTLVISGVFTGSAFTVLALGSGFSTFLIFELFNAVAISLFSGTDVALIYDSMAALKDKKQQERAMLGNRTFYGQAGETVAALIGGSLAAVSLALPAAVNAVTAWIPFWVALTLYEPARKKLDSHKHFQNFQIIFRALFRDSKLLRLIIFNYISLGLASYIVVWAFQGYWKELSVPLKYFGYLWAAYNLTVALVAKVAHKVEEKIGSVPILFLMGLLPILAYAGMAYFASAVGILFGLLLKVSRGLNQVILRDALNARVGGEMRATANSIASLGVRLSFVLLGPLVGGLIDHSGYDTAFTVLGVLYAGLFLLLIIPLTSQHKNFRPV